MGRESAKELIRKENQMPQTIIAITRPLFIYKTRNPIMAINADKITSQLFLKPFGVLCR